MLFTQIILMLIIFLKIGKKSVSLYSISSSSQKNDVEELSVSVQAENTNIDTGIAKNSFVQCNVELDLDNIPLIISETATIPNFEPSLCYDYGQLCGLVN